VSRYLPIMHKELQQFAVAMEAVVQWDRQRVIVGDTNTYLIKVPVKLSVRLPFLLMPFANIKHLMVFHDFHFAFL
jgi:hypothetical protein